MSCLCCIFRTLIFKAYDIRYQNVQKLTHLSIRIFTGELMVRVFADSDVPLSAPEMFGRSIVVINICT